MTDYEKCLDFIDQNGFITCTHIHNLTGTNSAQKVAQQLKHYGFLSEDKYQIFKSSKGKSFKVYAPHENFGINYQEWRNKND